MHVGRKTLGLQTSRRNTNTNSSRSDSLIKHADRNTDYLIEKHSIILPPENISEKIQENKVKSVLKNTKSSAKLNHRIGNSFWPNFCCCQRSPKGDTKYALSSNLRGDRYEYVIEKLAIRRVPLSIFATDEDLVESETISSSSFLKRFQRNIEDNDKKSAVTFASYYASVPSSTKVMPTILSAREDISEEDDNEQIKIDDQPSVPEMTSTMTQQEKEMVSHILNNFSSLYTLDQKEEIPRDPESLKGKSIFSSAMKSSSPEKQKIWRQFWSPTLPFRSREVSPTGRKQIPLNKNLIQQVQAQVHKTGPSYPTKTIFGMTNQLKNTINALGSAQPFLENCSNNRKILPDNNIIPSSLEQDSNELVEEESRELRCIALDKDVKLVLHRCYCEDETAENPPTLLKQEYNKPNIKKPILKTPTLKPFTPLKTNDFSKQRDEIITYFNDQIHRNESMPIVLEKEDNVAVLPSNFSFTDKATTTEQRRDIGKRIMPVNSSNRSSCISLSKNVKEEYTEEEPTMEINNLKGQNLKWKIIIKHHDEEESN